MGEGCCANIEFYNIFCTINWSCFKICNLLQNLAVFSLTYSFAFFLACFVQIFDCSCFCLLFFFLYFSVLVCVVVSNSKRLYFWTSVVYCINAYYLFFTSFFQNKLFSFVLFLYLIYNIIYILYIYI